MARPFVRVAIVLGFAVALTRLVGCVGDDAPADKGTLPDGGSCALGSESCGCTTGGACDNGLSCLSQRCVRGAEDGAVVTDGSAEDGSTTDAVVDALSDVREASPEGGTVLIGVSMSGAKEKPTPSNSPGTGGPGSLVLDTTTGALKGSVSFVNLVGNTTAAHIHQASCSASGPVLHTVTVTANVKAGTINVDVTLTPTEVMQAQKNELYLNLHTDQFGGGEIRGQLVGPGNTDCP